jgi:hypothetical protein
MPCIGLITRQNVSTTIKKLIDREPSKFRLLGQLDHRAVLFVTFACAAFLSKRGRQKFLASIQCRQIRTVV